MGETAPAAEPPPGAVIRRLMRAQDRAALGTLDRERGEPYVSLVMVAAAHDAAPLLYVSDLADHTRNLAADARASLLFDGTAGAATPLAAARACVQGRLAPVADAALLDRYVARHPDAAAYRSFGDFRLLRMEVERAHLVAGFGRIHWVDAADVLGEASPALVAAEAGIVAHMNEDHADAVALYARMLGLAGDGWRLGGLDPEGADLRREGGSGRLWFDRPVADAEGARAELVRLLKRAREVPGGG